MELMLARVLTSHPLEMETLMLLVHTINAFVAEESQHSDEVNSEATGMNMVRNEAYGC